MSVTIINTFFPTHVCGRKNINVKHPTENRFPGILYLDNCVIVGKEYKDLFRLFVHSFIRLFVLSLVVMVFTLAYHGLSSTEGMKPYV